MRIPVKTALVLHVAHEAVARGWFPGAVLFIAMRGYDPAGLVGADAARLEGTGEFVDSQALSPEGTFVRYDGEGRPPVTDGPFAETKDLIAGWVGSDGGALGRARAWTGEWSAPPGAGGKPIHEWLEVRPFLAAAPTITE